MIWDGDDPKKWKDPNWDLKWPNSARISKKKKSEKSRDLTFLSFRRINRNRAEAGSLRVRTLARASLSLLELRLQIWRHFVQLPKLGCTNVFARLNFAHAAVEWAGVVGGCTVTGRLGRFGSNFWRHSRCLGRCYSWLACHRAVLAGVCRI